MLTERGDAVERVDHLLDELIAVAIRKAHAEVAGLQLPQAFEHLAQSLGVEPARAAGAP